MNTASENRANRPKSVIRLYRDVFTHLRGQRHVFAGAVALLILAQLALLAVPFMSGKALDALQLHGTHGFHDASLWLSVVLLLACASWMLHGPGRLLERRGALLIRQRLAALLVDRLFRLPLSWHEAHHSGATAHRVLQSSQALSNFAQSQYIYLNSAVRLIGPLIALCLLNSVVGIAAIAGFALIIVSSLGFDRAMLRLANEENSAERHYSAALVDTLGNTGTVYALRQARAVAHRLERRLQAVFVPLRRTIVLNELKWLTVDLSTRVLNCCLVGLFVWLTSRADHAGQAADAVLLGSLYMVWEYAQQAAAVISSIASHFQTFARQNADYASADLIASSLAHEMPDAPAADGPVWQSLSIRDLSYRHAAARAGAPALERLALRLERGKRYAIIGESGSGKSTLMRVVAGIYPADRVTLTVDAKLVHMCSMETAHWLRARATFVPQDAEVYEGTLEENLALCETVKGPAAISDYSAALEVACATDFIEPSQQALQAPVAERAANWSGGQRSRVALARGILAARSSDIILLDEPTASLDPGTESRIYTNLFAAFPDACLISSIHRLSLLDRFDEVLVMKDGRLVAQGPVDELALTCSHFKKLTSVSAHATPSPSPARQTAPASVA